MSGRPKRSKKIKGVEEMFDKPKKWSEKEMETLLNCLMENGHKDFKKLQECFPNRSLENIKSFMRTIYDTGTKKSEKTSLDDWIDRCIGISASETTWKDCLQVAQVIKYLSVDGLLENHPLPQKCENINFAEAYRFIYQALMGYPLQPISPETGKFIHETLAELNNEIKKETAVIEKVKNHFKKVLEPLLKADKPVVQKKTQAVEIEKPLRVYEKRRPKLDVANQPPLKITIEANTSDNATGMQDFAVTIEGKEITQSIVQVPIVHETQRKPTEEEDKLLQSKSYNPFEIPEKWIQEPVNLNIIN